MGRYRIGFDFGTSTTKVCYYELDREEFGLFKWSGNIDRPTVASVENGVMSYARNADQDSDEIYRYFKMASFIDPNYLTLINQDLNDIDVSLNELYSNSNYLIHSEGISISAELVSSLYIADTVLYIQKNISNNQGGRRILGRAFFGGQREETNTFSYVFGFPTEFNQKQHVSRLVKMRSILYVAFKLVEVYGSLEKFEEANLSDLITMTEMILLELKSLPELLSDYLLKKGIRIYPEAAASLAFIKMNGSLTQGKYYASMDIGAGTSDVALFNLTHDGRIRYLASESISIASNNLAATYMGDSSNNAIARFNSEIKNGNGAYFDRRRFDESLDSFQFALSRTIYRLYNNRAFRQLQAEFMTVHDTFDGQQCLMYGGGAEYFRNRRNQEMLLHDNFAGLNPTNLVIAPLVERDNLNLTFKGADGLSNFELSKILVALGLSITISDHALTSEELIPDWLFLEDYCDGSNKFEYREIAHPSNENMYLRVYDIVAQEDF